MKLIISPETPTTLQFQTRFNNCLHPTIPGDIGGKETLGLLKEIDPDVRAIITSGYFSDGPMSGYIDHGFKAYVRKPYNLADIGETLNRVIGGKRDWSLDSRGNWTA